MREGNKRAPFAKNMLSMQVDLSKFTLASEEDKKSFEVMRPPSTFWRDGFKNFKKNKMAMTSVIVLVLIILAIVIVPYFVPYKYSETIRVDGKRDRTVANLKPYEWSEKEQEYIDEGGDLFPHVMGTDPLGRDYFIRVIIGTRVSLIVGFFASLIVLVIGLIYGSVSGFLGGKVDLVMMRIVDIIYSLPDTLMIILLSFVLKETIGKQIQGTLLAKVGTGMISMFIVFGLLYWVSMARLIRGQILSIKENEYVLAANSMGASNARTIRKHILPNCISVIIISTALQIPSAIFTESFLSFLGLGVAVPMPSLGSLASEARQGMQAYPYQLIFPAVIISLVVLTLNLIGDGLRDAFDPKLRK
ncbi:MAG: ABC transporter permease [Clostridiaceae bacterium]|jgi:oligopeptide transport system permease protein|nr:ABC transporter permease [Clostridiaceae bacterium]